MHERRGGLLHAGLFRACLACFCLEPDLPGMAVVDLLILLKDGACFEMIVDSFSVVSSETVVPCTRLTPTELEPTARRGVPLPPTRLSSVLLVSFLHSYTSGPGSVSPSGTALLPARLWTLPRVLPCLAFFSFIAQELFY